MCLLAVASKRKMTKEEFNNAWGSNPDGVGIGWYDGTKSHFVKGLMKQKKAWDYYDKEVNVFPHVIHFRYSSSGGISPDLTHPFIIGKTSHEPTQEYNGTRDMLFHNGVIHDWMNLLTILALNKIKVNKPYNDTMVLAVLLGFYKLAGYTYEDFLGDIAGKFVILRKDGLEMYGDFVDEKGISFSNTTYKTSHYYNYNYDKDYWKTKYNYDDKKTATDTAITKIKAKTVETECPHCMEGFSSTPDAGGWHTCPSCGAEFKTKADAKYNLNSGSLDNSSELD